MSIMLTCACGKRLRAKDELAGKRVKCPHCGNALVVAAPKVTIVSPPEEPGAAPARAATAPGEGYGFAADSVPAPPPRKPVRKVARAARPAAAPPAVEFSLGHYVYCVFLLPLVPLIFGSSD